MEITCLQMDVLISFYIEDELSSSLKKQVEEHLQKCPTCRAKYNIISSLFDDLKSYSDNSDDEKFSTKTYSSKRYKTFRNNLSAYVDNELPPEENIKIKKYTINNKNARKDLEDTYHIRKLMSESYKKTKSEARQDFSKKILKQLALKDYNNISFNPLIKVGAAFIFTVLFLSVIILFSLTFS